MTAMAPAVAGGFVLHRGRGARDRRAVQRGGGDLRQRVRRLRGAPGHQAGDRVHRGDALGRAGFLRHHGAGSGLQWLSQQPWLSWVPFFPISERLNIVTAGLLLALMAVPTIFTLAEDALNNVPRAFSEASLALGATQLQTVVRMIVPAALSGIVAAILLGFGRVIGETMVVLLVAGTGSRSRTSRWAWARFSSRPTR